MVHRSMAAVAVGLLLVAPAASGQGLSPSAGEPRLLIEPRGPAAQVAVLVSEADGSTRRVVLRETMARVERGASGSDAAKQTRFVDWSEDGQRWFSFSEDGGRAWTEPRRIETALRLRDGTVAPGSPMPDLAALVPAGPGALAAGALAATDAGSLFLVQFRTLSLPAWRRALADAGAELLAYFPHNAHVVRASPALAARLAGLPFVQRVEAYHPAYRLEPALRGWLSRPDPAPLRVNVLAFEWGSEAKGRIAALAESFGARVAQNPQSGHLLELWVDPEQLGRIAALDDVMWIDRWSPPAEDMDLVRQDSGAAFLESTTGQCGQGVRGEVMDGGVEQTHQDFDGILMHGTAGVASHGTATYGIVFGNGNRDGDGNAQATGHLVCQSQGIFASNSVSDRFAETAELKQAPFFASFQSNSWGNGLTASYTSLSHQMDDIIWRLDMAIAQSQSNSGTRDSRPQAWAKNIISVGAVRHRNTLVETDDAWANGASIGPAEDGRIKPDVHYWFDSIFTTSTNNGYTSGFGGTSAATPIVAGVLGLMVQLWSENLWGTNPQGATVFDRQPHASTIKALLVNNAKQYPFTGTTADLTRTHQGWGRPNVQIARERAGRSFIVDESVPLALNQAAVFNVRVPAGETELKVTMVYPDPPGTTSAALHRINDLDLTVTAPAGTVFHGNHGLETGVESTPGGSPNTVDTVENVFVRSPAAGTWTIEVRASEINQDAHLDTPEADAVFALVVTGATRVTTTTVFADDFETNRGWTANPSGTDTAVTGRWERGNPEPTTSNGVKQLGDTTSGVTDLVTARLAGAAAGTNDVDGGLTSIRSPAIVLPASGDLTLSFNAYLAHGSNSSSADFLRVRIVDGSAATTVFERLGAAVNVNGAWTPQSASLNAFRGRTVRILVEAADNAGASLVEAGIDDVRIILQQ